MFIAKKKIAGKEYYYLQQSIRAGDKIKSKSVAYLGKNKQEAEKKAKTIQKQMEKKFTDDTTLKTKPLSIEELANFCKRKGFVYPSGEIYGGLGGFWDFGPLGVELKNNLKRQWWSYHIHQRDDMVGIDGAIITNPQVWEASGHMSSFVVVAVVYKKCGYKTKVDKHELESARCDKCKSEYENKGEFNPMFTTQVGPIKEEAIKAYLRPETAQLIFADFKLIQDNARLQVPFGIAQIGKSFRNELSPREFIFRCREFEQMEIEYFISPNLPCPYIEETKTVDILIYDQEMQKNKKEPQMMNLYQTFKKGIIKTDWHAYWIAQEFDWFIKLGANPLNFRARQHTAQEKSHYAVDTWDLEYKFPMGWRELQGFANRGNFDLTQHQNHAKTNMELLDTNNKKFIPHVVCEPSLGVERALLVFLFDSYYHDQKRDNTVLKLHPKLAPYKAAVFPIIKQPQYTALAEQIVKELREEYVINYDKSGSIGRRYARNDEIGTPYCITVDEQSLKDKEVTIRDRDTTTQIRVAQAKLKETLRKLINQEIKFTDAGKKVVTRVKEIQP